ncbi:hypothetical protein ACQV5M_21345, partial [Leptospira sp. SA-E8]|uniref:hypothetical protein n=1 Tax=Leptospira sp. SA-E8 TaxID=3422259 RepID=UPI003EBCFF61
ILLAHAISLAFNLDLNEHARVDIHEAWEQIRLAYQQAPGSPALAATHAGLCDMDWRFAEELPLHREALTNMPSSPHALRPYNWHLLSTGQAENSLEHQQHILTQWPYAALENVIWAQMLAYVGARKAALKAIDGTRAAHPHNPLVAHAWCSLQATFMPRVEL